MRINNYDMILIGDNLSSLVAASFLCKNGHRILIIENEDNRWGTSEFFDEDATTFISGCAQNKLLYTIFRELGIPIYHQKKFKVNELSYQIAMPNCRIDVGSSWNLYYQEIKREFFNDLRSVSAVYKEIFKCDKAISEIFFHYLLHPPKFSSKLKSSFIMHLESLFKINEDIKGLSKLFSGELKNSLFKKILELQLGILNNTASDTSSMSTLFLLGSFQRGIVSEPDKLSLLKRILREQISKTHGEFLHVNKIESIKMTRRNPLKDKSGLIVKLEGEKRAFESKALITGQPLFFLPKLLTDIRHSGRFKKLVKRFTPKYAKLTFAYRIDRWGVPVGLRSRVMFVPDADLHKDNVTKPHHKKKVLVSVSQENDDGSNVNDCILRGTIKEPIVNGTIKGARIKRLHDEMTEYLRELIPFFDKFVRPLNNVKYEDIVLDRLNAGDFIYDSSFLKNLSLGEVESCEILKNIYFTGKEFLPQLGFEGEILSGWRTANVIINNLKLGKKF